MQVLRRPVETTVISGHFVMPEQCPLCPRKRTLDDGVGMSAMCRKRTPAPQQRTSLFDHFVSAREQLRWHVEAEYSIGRSSLPRRGWLIEKISFFFQNLMRS
jgi:hypothetical protein